MFDIMYMISADRGSMEYFVIFVVIAVAIIVVIVVSKGRIDFAKWLKNNGFVDGISYGDFLYDSVHNKWCKFGVRHIFSASETGNARINTIKRSGKANLYEVIIETKIALLPVVRINCGTSKYNAQNIKATINIIRSSQK